MPDDLSPNETLVHDFFATLSTGDLEAVRALLHPHGSWEVMATTRGAGRIDSADAIVDDFLSRVRGRFVEGDPKVEVTLTFASGPMVAAETTAAGTLRNGNAYHNRYAWIIEVKDGMVCHLREYMDTAYIASVVD